MKRLKFCVVFQLVLSFFANAEIKVIVSDEGYWYGQAYCNASCDAVNRTCDIPFEICMQAISDVSALSPAEVLCFLSGFLNQKSPFFQKVKTWNYFSIKQSDTSLLNAQKIKLEIGCRKYKFLFDKIQRFRGEEY